MNSERRDWGTSRTTVGARKRRTKNTGVLRES